MRLALYFMSTGSYLRYENKPKYWVCVPYSSQEIKWLEVVATDYKTRAINCLSLYVSLSQALTVTQGIWLTKKSSGGYDVSFYNMMVANMAWTMCCSSMITFTCNFVSHTLYAVHVHRRFLSRKGVKFHTSEEEQQWAKAIKAMNAL